MMSIRQQNIPKAQMVSPNPKTVAGEFTRLVGNFRIKVLKEKRVEEQLQRQVGAGGHHTLRPALVS